MVPETSQTDSVQLFRASRFPDQWQLVSTLIEGYPVVDTTFVRAMAGAGSCSPMSASAADRPGTNCFCLLPTRRSGRGGAIPKIVKSDARAARPREICQAGQPDHPPLAGLHQRYGSGIVFSEVELLSDTDIASARSDGSMPRGPPAFPEPHNPTLPMRRWRPSTIEV